MLQKTVECIHLADLHISENDKDYSLKVLEEIFTRFAEADFMLMSGDIFDSFGDLVRLKSDLLKAAESFGGEIIYIPGNHEALGMKKHDSLEVLDLGKIKFCSKKPFSFFTLRKGGEDIEFLAIPHQQDCSSFRQWDVPEKKARTRIALAHGNIPDLIEFTGPGEEEGAESIDSHLFLHHKCDYAALGHIHSHRIRTEGSCSMAYAGSSRVWRKGESGEHGVYRLSIADSVTCEFVPLENAGTYRKIFLPVNFECEKTEIPNEILECSSVDHLDIRLQGMVEDENKLSVLESRIEKLVKKKARRLDMSRDDVLPLPGISNVPLVKQFLEIWLEKKPVHEEDLEIWYRARQIALHEVKGILEKQS